MRDGGIHTPHSSCNSIVSTKNCTKVGRRKRHTQTFGIYALFYPKWKTILTQTSAANICSTLLFSDARKDIRDQPSYVWQVLLFRCGQRSCYLIMNVYWDQPILKNQRALSAIAFCTFNLQQQYMITLRSREYSRLDAEQRQVEEPRLHREIIIPPNGNACVAVWERFRLIKIT